MNEIMLHYIGGDDDPPPPTEYNLISMDTSASEVYFHDGFSDIITSSFSKSITQGACLSDPTNFTGNLIYWNANTCYVLDGLTSTILTSFAMPGGSTRGIAITNDGNLLTLDANDLYIHIGITASIGSIVNNLNLSSSANAMAVNPADGLLYICDGFGPTDVDFYVVGSDTASGSITLAEGRMHGITFDEGGNMITAKNGSPGTIYKYAGATNTLVDSFPSPGNSPRGLAWVTEP